MSQMTKKNERLIKGILDEVFQERRLRSPQCKEIERYRRDEDRSDRSSTRSGTVYGSLARKSDASMARKSDAAKEFSNKDMIKYLIGLQDKEDDDSQEDLEYDYQYDLSPSPNRRKQVIYFSLILYFIHEHSYLPMHIYRIYLKKNWTCQSL